MVAETSLQVDDFVVPLFITFGTRIRKKISSMPGYYKYSLDMLSDELKTLQSLGLKAVLLFAEVPEKLKDNQGTEALNPKGLMQESIRFIKKNFPDLLVMSDVALDPFSSYGHDGIVRDGEIVNDETVEVLSKMAVSHAEAGVDFIAPSDMMDGRIRAMRENLDEQGFLNTGIVAYSAKYASSFYGPFRDALDSAPGFGDKKSYQMNPANARVAIDEALTDIEEGADMVMIKPAIHYLDIIHRVSQVSNVPVVAYHVSGEYAQLKAAAANGWIEEEAAMLEATLSIKRAGADIIITYFAKEIARYLRANK